MLDRHLSKSIAARAVARREFGGRCVYSPLTGLDPWIGLAHRDASAGGCHSFVERRSGSDLPPFHRVGPPEQPSRDAPSFLDRGRIWSRPSRNPETWCHEAVGPDFLSTCQNVSRASAPAGGLIN